MSRWAAALPRQEGGDGRCCVLAGAVPTVRSEQPRRNISNELGRLSCVCISLGDVQAVCAGAESPLGSSDLEQEVLGYGVAVAPREAQAVLVAGAARQDRGMGLDCREMSYWARIIRASSPALEKSFVFASQLCAQCSGNVNRFAVFPEVFLASPVCMLLPL